MDLFVVGMHACLGVRKKVRLMRQLTCVSRCWFWGMCMQASLQQQSQWNDTKRAGKADQLDRIVGAYVAVCDVLVALGFI